MVRVVREGGPGQFSPYPHPESRFERLMYSESGAAAIRQGEQVIVPVGVVPEHNDSHSAFGEGFQPRFHRVVAPLAIARQENGKSELAGVRRQVLFQIGLAVLIAYGPGIKMADDVFPRTERHSAMRQIMALLDSAVQLPDW